MPVVNREPRRNEYEIWASILDLLVEDNSTLTNIVISVRLKRKRAKRYLDSLIAEGLIEAKKGDFNEYTITKDGLVWLKSFKSLFKARRTHNGRGSDF